MRTDLDHLPDRKQRDLKLITEVLFTTLEESTSRATQNWKKQGRILKVILYGSYARGDWVDDLIGGYKSDYDILVVVNDVRLTDIAEYWTKAEDRFVRDFTINNRICAPVSFIVHSFSDVNAQLERGRPFFIDIIEQGITIYDSEIIDFIPPKRLNKDEVFLEAKRHYEQWYYSSYQFWRGARHAIDDGDYNKAAFDLHQTVEQLYHTLLLTLTLYSPKSHKLNFLRAQAEPLVPELIAVWPRDTKFAQRCFELLRQAYVKARYSPHYKITPAELEWITERVELLQRLVKEACERHLAPPN